MNKAERANNLLRDEFFVEILTTQMDYYRHFVFCSAEDDVEGRERALTKLRAIEELEAALQSLTQQVQIEKKRFKVF